MAENGNSMNGGTDKDTLIMLSGVAFIVFGAGLILSNPLVEISGTGRYRQSGTSRVAGPGPLSQAAVDVRELL